ncbi:ROK family protein [Promicromonospora thailandica]|uniref:Sugar kinase of the NBD/HSP70 family, may containing an N-terminal HTH domain n=1 Tax=Promicromonospora thailandica TaxID=765201 RepID=A0A9X2G0D7_9MICO|nr:ROK family protein [Promicromonospora thailandica]MCP2262932.1 Sugar kinase of the NBD/HSP70 family, may containing an N-terminal HTH domain [Promicromonospora thailandica]BFF18284.1 ROK family protein [Promicromonospora thailandica]
MGKDGMGRYTVGLDIGGTKILGALLDPEGEVVATVRRSTVHGAEGLVAGAAQAVRDVVASGGAELSALAGVGLGIPGIVDHRSGTVKHAVNLGVHDDELPLAELLSAQVGGVPVVVENDLNVAAVGAAHVLERSAGPADRAGGTGGSDGLAVAGGTDAVGGAGGTGTPGVANVSGAAGAAGEADEHEDLAFLALGTGLASGLVLDGELRRGASGAAGEIGHIPVDPLGPECPCGQRGCLERFASGKALEAAWPSRHGKPSPVELFEAARAGDEEALVVRDRFAAAVASAVRLLVLTTDVRHVVLGGGVAQLGAELLDVVQDALREQAKVSAFLGSLRLAERVRLAPTHVPVAAVGAAVLGRRG